MIVDSSAVVAILRQEPDADRYAIAIERAHLKRMGAPSLLEICMVLAGSKGTGTLDRVEGFLRDSDIAVIAFTPAMARVAVEAFAKYGKGRHPAGLNFGDCMSYALARTELMPLLFKGDDFRLTDVETVL